MAHDAQDKRNGIACCAMPTSPLQAPSLLVLAYALNTFWNIVVMHIHHDNTRTMANTTSINGEQLCVVHTMLLNVLLISLHLSQPQISLNNWFRGTCSFIRRESGRTMTHTFSTWFMRTLFGSVVGLSPRRRCGRHYGIYDNTNKTLQIHSPIAYSRNHFLFRWSFLEDWMIQLFDIYRVTL